MALGENLLLGAVVAFCVFDLYELITHPDDASGGRPGGRGRRIVGGGQAWAFSHG